MTPSGSSRRPLTCYLLTYLFNSINADDKHFAQSIPGGGAHINILYDICASDELMTKFPGLRLIGDELFTKQARRLLTYNYSTADSLLSEDVRHR